MTDCVSDNIALTWVGGYEGSKPVSAGETTKLHVQFNGTDYTVHDITVE